MKYRSKIKLFLKKCKKNNYNMLIQSILRKNATKKYKKSIRRICH